MALLGKNQETGSDPQASFDGVGAGNGSTVMLVRHRQTKGAANRDKDRGDIKLLEKTRPLRS